MRHRPHLMVDTDWDGDLIGLDEAAAAHLTRVLRYQQGGPVSYTDGAGRLGEGTWTGVPGVERGFERLVDRPSRLTVAVAPPRQRDRQRFIVEKAQELGMSKLVWLKTDLFKGRVPGIERASAWRRSALEQSCGAWCTEIEGPVALSTLSHPILCDVGGRSLRDVFESQPLTIAIGPEGGWSVAELEACEPTGSIGSTVLRTETAVVVAATIVLHGGLGSDTIALLD